MSQAFHAGATALAGFCAGRACRAAGDTAAVGIGGVVVLLGGLTRAGYITVDVPKIEKQVCSLLATSSRPHSDAAHAPELPHIYAPQPGADDARHE